MIADAQALTDWAMDEYHYAADPKLIYKIACEGGHSLDWMADCGVKWRLGEVPVYVAPKNSTLDHHVLKMKDATDAMFAFGQRNGVRYKFQCPATRSCATIRGALWAWWRARISTVRCTSTPRARHPDGRRLLQQQGAAGEIHPHGGHGCASSYLVGGETGECFRMGLARAPMCRASTARPALTAAWIGRQKAASGRVSCTTA